jgi:hypothetical protein
MSLSREALLGAVDVPTATVEIPELGGFVVVRGMTARERTMFEKKFVTEHRGRTKRNFDAFREQICVFCCVEPKLTEADVEALSLVRADVIERIASKAMQLSGITEKDVDELGQSFEAKTASSSSSSASPEN